MAYTMAMDDTLLAIAQPRRRAILTLVRDSELSAGEIARHFDLVVERGIENVVAIRGDRPPDPEFRPPNDGFRYAVDLIRFVRDLPPSLRDQTSKDWQAYQASGARSVKQFNAGAWRVSISTLNMALRLEAQPVSAQVAFLFAGSEIGLSTRHAGIGAAIRRVLKAAATLNENGLFDETA